MAQRIRYLLAYDIRDPRRLRRVHQVAKAYGDPLQYSLFTCDLSASELLLLRRDLSTEMDMSVDSVAIFDLGLAGARSVERVAFLGPRRPLPGGGPAIW